MESYVEDDEDDDWGDFLVSKGAETNIKSPRWTNAKPSANEPDDDCDDLEELLRKKTAGNANRKPGAKEKTEKPKAPLVEEDDWGDLAIQLSPRGAKNVQKVLQNFEEDDEDDWGDLGEQLSPRGGKKKEPPTTSKAGGSSICKKPAREDFGDDEEDWGDIAESLSTSSSQSRQPGGNDLDDLASEGGELDLAAKLALMRKARQEDESAPKADEEDNLADDDPFGDEFDWSDNDSGSNT